MGLTQKLGTIPLAIQTDSSNNVGIGGAANASYKLAVTGASLFSSSITANGVMSLGNDGTYGATYKTLGLTGNTNGTHRIFAGTGDNLYIAAATGRDIVFWTDGSSATKASISTTGAATFSSSVTAGTLSRIGDVFIGGRSGTYASYTDGVFGDNLHLGATATGGAVYINTALSRNLIINPVGGNVSIGSTTDSGYRLYAKGTYGLYIEGGSSSANSAVYITDQSGNNLYFQVRGDGYVRSPTTYNNTTANAANVSISSSGYFERSTSSIKYKKDVIDYDKGLAEVMAMRPVYYKGKNPNDGDKQFAGLIAEEIDAIGLNEFVTYAEDGSPDALAYQNMIALLVKSVQELSAKVTALENK